MKKAIEGGTKKFRDYQKALNTGFISEGEIQGLRKTLHALDRRNAGYSTSITSPKMTQEEMDVILERIQQESPRITNEQAQKGLAWLMNQWKTPKGAERKNNPFGYREQKVLEDFAYFTLEDFQDASRGGGMLAFYVPVYAVHSKSNGSFEYYATSWQSGGVLTICA